MSWHFVRFQEILFQTYLKVSACYLGNTKKFYSPKKCFLSRTAKIDPKAGVSRSNFQWRFWAGQCSLCVLPVTTFLLLPCGGPHTPGTEGGAAGNITVLQFFPLTEALAIMSAVRLILNFELLNETNAHLKKPLLWYDNVTVGIEIIYLL